MIRFGAITDVQYANIDDASGRSYRGSIPKLLEAAGVFAREKFPFVLQFGDAMNGDWNNHAAVCEIFKVAEKNGVVWRHVLGNHDLLVSDVQKSAIYADFNVPASGYYDFAAVDPGPRAKFDNPVGAFHHV